jgi:hypothetical protein
LFGTPTLTCFDVVIHKDTLVGAFNGGPGLELLLECLCISWDGRKKPEVIIRLYVDSSSLELFEQLKASRSMVSNHFGI